MYAEVISKAERANINVDIILIKALKVVNLLFLTSRMGERFLFPFAPNLNKRCTPSHFGFSLTARIWLKNTLCQQADNS